MCGLVSQDAAKANYGVIFVSDGGELHIDESATQMERDRLKAARGVMPMYDRGEYFNRVKAEGGLVWPEGWEDPDLWAAVEY
jgi:N-methylhydantoinase B